MHANSALAGLSGAAWDYQKLRCEGKTGLAWTWCILTNTETPAPPPPSPPGAPQTVEQLTVPGSWTVDMAIALGWDQTKETEQEFINRVAALKAQLGEGGSPPAVPACSWYQTRDDAGLCSFGGVFVWGLVAAAGAVAILAYSKRQ